MQVNFKQPKKKNIGFVSDIGEFSDTDAELTWTDERDTDHVTLKKKIFSYDLVNTIKAHLQPALVH